MPGASRTSLVLFALALAAVDGGVLFALGDRRPPLPGDPSDYALCQTEIDGQRVRPTSVAVTYLDARDARLAPETIRSWFRDVDPLAVDVYRLEGADGTRRLSLELSRGKWDDWPATAYRASGGVVCERVRAALLERRIGRPASGEAGSIDPRHSYELIYARRPHLYRAIEWIGTLEHLLEGDTLSEQMTWLGEESMP